MTDLQSQASEVLQTITPIRALQTGLRFRNHSEPEKWQQKKSPIMGTIMTVTDTVCPVI